MDESQILDWQCRLEAMSDFDLEELAISDTISRQRKKYVELELRRREKESVMLQEENRSSLAAESNSIAKASNDIAKRSNRIAIIALVIAILALIASMVRVF